MPATCCPNRSTRCGTWPPARGDEDENQRLLAAVLHLRDADENIGYGHDQIAALEGGGK